MSLMNEVKYNNLNEVLDKQAAAQASKIVIQYEDKKLTYGQFREKVLKLANVFLSLGAKKKDFIGIQTSNSIEFAVSIYACWRIGAVATPLISLWQVREVAEAIDRAKIGIMVVKSSITAVASKCCKLEGVKTIIIGDTASYKELPGFVGEYWDMIEKAPATDPKILVAKGELASCHFTSGTTGQSKGVLHDHLGYLYAGVVHTKTFGLSEKEDRKSVV